MSCHSTLLRNRKSPCIVPIRFQYVRVIRGDGDNVGTSPILGGGKWEEGSNRERCCIIGCDEINMEYRLDTFGPPEGQQVS